MNRKSRAAWVGIFLLLAVANYVPSARAAHCSLATTAGKYGFTLTGTLILPTVAVPIAAVGKAVLDASGNASGTESRSVGGGFADETLAGTYAVNTDCTGTATIQFFESGQLVRTSILSLVVDDNHREIRMVQKSLQLPNGAFLPVVVTVEARRISKEED